MARGPARPAGRHATAASRGKGARARVPGRSGRTRPGVRAAWFERFRVRMRPGERKRGGRKRPLRRRTGAFRLGGAILIA